MKKSISILITIMLFFIVTSISNAQFRMSVGPALGLNLNLMNGSDLENGGSGLGLLFAGQIDMTFNQDRSLGVLTTLAFYDNRSSSFSLTIPVPQQGFNQSQDTDVSLAYFQLETLFKFRLPVGVYFVFGPALGFNLSAERNIKVKNTFNNGQQQSFKVKETLKNTNTRFALVTGSGYDIRLSQLITLTPQLTFRYGITDVIEDFSAKVITFQAAVACKFHILN